MHVMVQSGTLCEGCDAAILGALTLKSTGAEMQEMHRSVREISEAPSANAVLQR